MRYSLALGLLQACVLPRLAYALVGIDTAMYNPPCAYACSSALSPLMLSCSDHEAATGDHAHGSSAMTSPSCRAGDTAYLTTLAWCMSTRCAGYDVPTWLLEKFWEEQASGDPGVPPKWDYGATIATMSEPPAREFLPDEMLNFTALVPEAAWTAQFNAMTTVEFEETVHAIYGYGDKRDTLLGPLSKRSMHADCSGNLPGSSFSSWVSASPSCSLGSAVSRT